MNVLQCLQLSSTVAVCAIQVFRQYRNNNTHWVWGVIKTYFNYLTVQVYLISTYTEIKQIYCYIYMDDCWISEKQQLFADLQLVLAILAMSIYAGILMVILFLRNLQNYGVDIQNITNPKLYIILMQSLLQSAAFQIIFVIFSFLQHNTLWEALQLTYIRALLLFSAVSSMKPIIQVLLETPLQNFITSFQALSQPFIKEIKFKYVQLQQKSHQQSDEEAARIVQDFLPFDEDRQDGGDNLIDKCKQGTLDWLISCWNCIKLCGRSVNLIYNTVQLCLAFTLLFGFVCIFIQVADPNSDLLSQLNAVNYVSDIMEYMNTTTPNPQQSYDVLFRWVEVIVIMSFKLLFILIMYFSSNDFIQYSRNSKLIDNVTNLMVIIRKTILNFSLIALLTTLYPNLTFTINNSDCFKHISYIDGKLMQNQIAYQWKEQDCPATLIYLITSKVFDSQATVIIGLCVLVLYIIYAIYIIIVKIRRNSNMIRQ